MPACDVAPGELGQLAFDLELAHRFGQIEAGEAEPLRQLVEEIVELADADRRQHLPAILIGMGQVAHGRRSRPRLRPDG